METLQIINAVVVGNLTVRLYFNDNSEQIVDIGDFIRRKPHPQYNKYLDQEQFKDFSIENGNIVWGKDWDLIFPIEQLHKGEIL